MPRGDRTGPNGLGAKTGRNLGYCADSADAGFVNENKVDNRRFGFGRQNSQRRGRSFGPGMGLGFRHGFHSFQQNQMLELKEKTLIENEINSLKDQLESLETRLQAIRDEQ